jgi:hypothetical protein
MMGLVWKKVVAWMTVLAVLPPVSSQAVPLRVPSGYTIGKFSSTLGITEKVLWAANAHTELPQLLKTNRLRMPDANVVFLEPGDTAWSLAQRHKTPVNDILELNEFSSLALREGARILVPNTAPRFVSTLKGQGNPSSARSPSAHAEELNILRENIEYGIWKVRAAGDSPLRFVDIKGGYQGTVKEKAGVVTLRWRARDGRILKLILKELPEFIKQADITVEQPQPVTPGSIKFVDAEFPSEYRALHLGLIHQ